MESSHFTSQSTHMQNISDPFLCDSKHTSTAAYSNLKKNQSLYPQNISKIAEQIKNVFQSSRQDQVDRPLPQIFSTQLLSCLGVIRLPETNQQRNQILGTTAIISSNIVLTTFQTIYDSKNCCWHKNMRLKVYSNEQQYEIEDQGMYNQDINTKLYLLLLKEEINDWKSYPLGVNMPKIIQDIYFPVITQNKQDQLGVCFEGIELETSKNSEDIIELKSLGRQGYRGGPAFMLFQGQWYIVGFNCGFSQRYNCQVAKIFTQANIDNIIDAQLSVIPQELQIYRLNNTQMRMQSMEPYIQQKRASRQQYWSDFFLSRHEQYFTVNGVNLYYQSILHTAVQDLSQQYFKQTYKNMNLSCSQFTIPSEFPLTEAIESIQQQKKFENILNFLNINDKTFIQNICAEYMQNLKQKMHRFELRLNNKNKETKITIKMRKSQFTFDELFIEMKQGITINNVIEFLKSNFYYSFQKIQIYTNNEAKIIHNYDEKLIDIQDHKITIIFHELERFISNKSHIISKTKGKVGIDQVAKAFNRGRLLSYQNGGKSSFQPIEYIFTAENIYKFWRISYKHYNIDDHLDCTCDTLIKLSNDSWIMAKDIQQGERLKGINDQEQPQIVQYEVTKVQIIGNDERIKFQNIQVKYTHVFVANHLIVHNENPVQPHVRRYDANGSMVGSLIKDNISADQLFPWKYETKNHL